MRLSLLKFITLLLISAGVSNINAGGTYQQNPLLHAYNVSFYKLDVHVDPGKQHIEGSVTVKAVVTSKYLDSLVLELKQNMDIESITFDDVAQSYEHTGDNILIAINEPILQGEYFNVQVNYSGYPTQEGFFSGMNTANTPYGDPVLWTLSEPLNARQWWPCKQVLEDKADSVYVFITTPGEFTAASNGLLTDTIHLPGNMIRYEWISRYPTAYYLISLAVSKYQEYNFYAPLSNPDDSVFVQNFIYDHPGVLTKYKDDIDRTKDFMELFSKLYGDYPFADEKYGHVMAPMGGGMEHQTLSTMSSFSYNLTSHELAHHWFGNNVTCATWNDIWINEGFATYSEYLALQYLEGQHEADRWMENVHEQVASKPGGSTYVPYSQTTDVWRIFNGRLSYRKGAAILHLLRLELDDDKMFFNVLKEFQQRYKDSVATGDDFRQVLDDITGKSWQWFFDQWYYGEGHPIFDIKYSQHQDSVFIWLNQTGSAGNPRFFKTSAEIKLIGENADTVITIFQSKQNEKYTIYFDNKLEEIQFDPANWLFKEVTTLSEGYLENGLLSIYPNPFADHVVVKAYDNKGINKLDVKIYNSKGKEVIVRTLPAAGGTINTKSIPAGIYILSISGNEKKLINKKIIKTD